MTERRTLGRRIVARLQDWTLRRDNAAGPAFATIHHRPKRAEAVGTWSDPAIAMPPTAVAMQGPIATEDDFTLETLRLYSRLMPETRLILSTWEDTDPALLAPIERLGVEVALSPKPANPGMINVNMQIVGASAAVRRAVEGGAQWVLKTRTDQRLYAPNALAYLHTLATGFPLGGAATRQRHRIVGVGHGSLKFAPYHVTDQTVFGHAEDMLAYWTPPLREEPFPPHWPRDRAAAYLTVPIAEACRFAAPESYFASSFLERMGRALDWTLADSWAAYRDCFCFADYASTDFYWVKSQTYSRKEYNLNYESESIRREMGFAEWMLLYSGKLRCETASRYERSVFASRFTDAVAPVECPEGQGVAASDSRSGSNVAPWWERRKHVRL